VAGILKESGYFHVEETADPAVKLFELIEQVVVRALGESPRVSVGVRVCVRVRERVRERAIVCVS